LLMQGEMRGTRNNARSHHSIEIGAQCQFVHERRQVAL